MAHENFKHCKCLEAQLKMLTLRCFNSLSVCVNSLNTLSFTAWINLCQQVKYDGLLDYEIFELHGLAFHTTLHKCIPIQYQGSLGLY